FERGFITETGGRDRNNLPPPEKDYLLGNCPIGSCATFEAGEFRDFFGFAIPDIDGVITSVEFVISTETIKLSQAPSLTALFTSLDSTDSFAALGTGTPYGSVSFGASDAFSVESFALNQNAINAILTHQGSNLLVGARDISDTLFGPDFPNQFVFAHTGG